MFKEIMEFYESTDKHPTVQGRFFDQFFDPFGTMVASQHWLFLFFSLAKYQSKVHIYPYLPVSQGEKVVHNTSFFHGTKCSRFMGS